MKRRVPGDSRQEEHVLDLNETQRRPQPTVQQLQPEHYRPGLSACKGHRNFVQERAAEGS
jgi:hypothetical protein